MKDQEFRHTWCSLLVLFCLTAIGCATPPALKMPEQFPPIVRQYKHVTIAQWRSALVDTGIYLKKGDFFSVLTDGFYKRYYMRTVIGEEWVPSDPYHRNSPVSGSHRPTMLPPQWAIHSLPSISMVIPSGPPISFGIVITVLSLEISADSLS